MPQTIDAASTKTKSPKSASRKTSQRRASSDLVRRKEKTADRVREPKSAPRKTGQRQAASDLIRREEEGLKALLARVEAVETVAWSLDDDRRTKLLDVCKDALRMAPYVRVIVAAHVLELSERTIRTWTEDGLLRATKERGRVVLEPARLHEVAHLVKELRAAGKKRDLINAVWMRLQDQALLDRDDLKESIEQMQQGRGTVVRTKASSSKQID